MAYEVKQVTLLDTQVNDIGLGSEFDDHADRISGICL